MEDKKYYWVQMVYLWNQSSEYRYEESVTDQHPFKYAADYRHSGSVYDAQINNWKEITLPEYDLFNMLDLYKDEPAQAIQ